MISDFQLFVYDNAYAGTTTGINKNKTGILAQPSPEQISSLVFSTRMHGGFDECIFSFAGSELECAIWKHRFMSQHLEIMSSGDMVYHGFIKSLGLALVNNLVHVQALGYYWGLDDNRYAGADNGDQAYKTAVSNYLLRGAGGGASADYRGYLVDGDVSSVVAISNTVPTVDTSQGRETAREVLERWTEMGDPASAITKYWASIWTGRQLHVAAQGTTARWYVRREQLSEGLMVLDRSTIFNRVIVSYVTTDGVPPGNRTTYTANDTTSQQRHGLLTLPYVAGSMAGVQAAQLAAALLAHFKILRDRTTFGVKGSISDSAGGTQPLWKVHAGDIIQFNDLTLPDQAVGDAIAGRNQWMIRSTRYDVETNSLEIVPDQEETSLEKEIEKIIKDLRMMTEGMPLAAGQLTSGLVAQARLGTGSGGAGAKALLDNQTWGTLTGGSLLYVGSVTVAGAAVQQVDSPALDLDTNHEYIVEGTIVYVTGIGAVYLLANSDTTLTDYYRRNLVIGGAGVSTTAGNEAVWGVNEGTATSQWRARVWVDPQTGYAVAETWNGYASISAAGGCSFRIGYWCWNNGANVTLLSCRHAGGAYIGIGSAFHFWKKVLA